MLRIEAEKGLVVLKFDRDYNVVSTLPSPRRTSTIVFLEVDKDECIVDYEGFRRRVLDELGVGDALLFVTAARLPRSFAMELLVANGLSMVVAASVGLRPLTCTRVALHEPLRGTINIAVVVDEPGLRENAAVDLLATLAAARTSALHLVAPTCSNHRLTLGTVSDAIAVLYRSGDVLFSGPATTVGGAAADAVEFMITRLFSEHSADRAVQALRGILEAYARHYGVNTKRLLGLLCTTGGENSACNTEHAR